MDLTRFHALYAAEAQEQVERLVRALLTLEAGDATAGTAEAFRAMHTLKSVAATMGHAQVAGLAHALEDTLETLRGAAELDGATVDALLRRSDELQAAVALSVQPEVGPPSAAAALAEPALEPVASIAQVRVEQSRLDDLSDVAGELAIVQARLTALMPPTDEAGVELSDRMRRLIGELQAEVLALRMVPLGGLFERCRRQVRALARQLGKEIELRLEGGELRIDGAILDGIAEPLLHLIRNAVDHGVETPAEREAAGKPARGTLLLRAQPDRAGVRIEVRDDGRGVQAAPVALNGAGAEAAALHSDELLRQISEPGFTTATRVSDVSGRGIGLDIVTTGVRALGGALSLETRPGAGSAFVLRLPLTRSLVQALRVRVGGEQYVIPLTHVAEALELDGAAGDGEAGAAPGAAVARAGVVVRGEVVPLVSLAAVLGTGSPGAERAAVLAEVGERRAALAVDELIGREQFLIKSFAAPAGALPVFSGATLLGDGRPALVLDPVSVI